MDNTKKEFQIIIDKIFEPAKLGIRNAMAYSAIVLNKKNKISISDLQVDNQFSLYVPNYPENSITEDFTNFVVKNALCEMMTSFETTLVEIYDKIQILVNTRNKKRYLIKIHRETLNKFKEYKFEKKLKKISKYIATKDEDKQLWKNLKYVRNCITHNYSQVDKGDIKLKIPVFTIKYTDLTTKKEYCSSSEQPTLILGNVQGHPGEMTIQFIDKEKIFKHGEIIKFTNNEINFLIYAMNNSVNLLYKNFMYYLIDNGHIINYMSTKNAITKREDFDKLMQNNGKTLYINMMPKSIMEV